LHSIAQQKSVDAYQSYERISSGTFFMAHGVYSVTAGRQWNGLSGV